MSKLLATLLMAVVLGMFSSCNPAEENEVNIKGDESIEQESYPQWESEIDSSEADEKDNESIDYESYPESESEIDSSEEYDEEGVASEEESEEDEEDLSADEKIVPQKVIEK
ncbi:MAG: hypothetical protein ABII27_06810 [bacterium]